MFTSELFNSTSFVQTSPSTSEEDLWVSQDVLPSSVPTLWNPLSTPGAVLSRKRSAHHHHQWRQPRYHVRMHSNAQSPYAAAGKSARAPAMYDGLSSNQFFHLLQLPRTMQKFPSKWETRHAGAPFSVDSFLISVAKFWLHLNGYIPEVSSEPSNFCRSPCGLCL